MLCRKIKPSGEREPNVFHIEGEGLYKHARFFEDVKISLKKRSPHC
jgi:hypothetical protein